VTVATILGSPVSLTEVSRPPWIRPADWDRMPWIARRRASRVVPAPEWLVTARRNQHALASLVARDGRHIKHPQPTELARSRKGGRPRTVRP
jgi:hypothetical protein